jgi:ABC-2 type transport system permease protein
VNPYASVGPIRLSLIGIIRSEWIKFASLRTNHLVLSFFIIVSVGFNAILCFGLYRNGNTDDLAGLHISELIAQMTIMVGTLVSGVLGVLSMTHEYSSGLIRSSFTAVPRRLPVVVGKAVILIITASVTSLVAIALSYLAAWMFLRGTGVDLSFYAGENGRILGGVVLYVVTVTLLGLMVGSLIHTTPGALAVIIAVAFVLPLGADLLHNLAVNSAPGGYALWQRLIFYAIELLPTEAGEPLVTWAGTTSDLTPSLHLGIIGGVAVMWAWVLVFAIPALIRLRVRDVA